MIRPLAIAAVAIVTAVCGSGLGDPQGQAALLLNDTPLIDGHEDLLIHFVDANGQSFRAIDTYDISRETRGQVDLPRLRAGGVGAAIFTTAILDKSDREKGIAESTGVLRQLAAAYPEDFEIVTSSAALVGAVDAGRLAILMGLEGGEQLGGSLDAVSMLHDHGIRAMTLVWENSNELGDSSSDLPQHGGLAAFGGEVVELMNRLGMVIDLSHAAESTAREVLALTRAPVVFSHSSAAALCPTPRNVSDELLRAVSDNGGVVMVSFVPYLTTPDHLSWYDRGEARWAELERLHHNDTGAISRGMDEWEASDPQPRVTVQDVADHVEHIARVAGVDHVGLGSDFDGMDAFRVTGLDDASKFPALLRELSSRGWTREALAKLGGGNFLRVLRAVEEVADRAAAARPVAEPHAPGR